MLVPSLLRCKKDHSGNDVEARERCQLAVRFAMDNVRSGIPMGGSHAIGHQLGPLGVAHGVTSCIMMPAVMKYNIKHADGNAEIPRRQHKVAEVLWDEPEVAEVLKIAELDREKSDLGDVIDAIVCFLGLPRSLKDVGVDPGKVPALAERALADFWSPTNPVPLLKSEQTLEILQAVS
jgi:alcohol dehydrogenase class IV